MRPELLRDIALVVREVSTRCTLQMSSIPHGSNIILCSRPQTQLSVLTEVAPLETSEGTPEFRGQNQTLMKELVRSMAYLSSTWDRYLVQEGDDND